MDRRPCMLLLATVTTLATTRHQGTLSSDVLMSCVGLTLSFHDAHKLSRYFSFWRPSLSSPLPLQDTDNRQLIISTVWMNQQRHALYEMNYTLKHNQKKQTIFFLRWTTTAVFSVLVQLANFQCYHELISKDFASKTSKDCWSNFLVVYCSLFLVNTNQKAELLLTIKQRQIWLQFYIGLFNDNSNQVHGKVQPWEILRKSSSFFAWASSLSLSSPEPSLIARFNLSMSWFAIASLTLCLAARRFTSTHSQHSSCVARIVHCVPKTHQLWNNIGRNYEDRFWWNLAEIFKIL